MRPSTRMVVLGKDNNLIAFPEDVENAYWTKSGNLAPVVTPNVAESPIGTLSADRIVFSPVDSAASSLLRVESDRVVPGALYTSSFWIKANSETDVGKIILHRHVARQAYLSIQLTNQWEKITRTEVAFNKDLFFALESRPALGSSPGTVSILLWGMRLEVGSSAKQ